jgi:hypothetical protein
MLEQLGDTCRPTGLTHGRAGKHRRRGSGS